MRCFICERPDASKILEALKKSKHEAARTAGIAYATFHGWAKRHDSLPSSHMQVQLPPAPKSFENCGIGIPKLEALKAAEPEDILWDIYKSQRKLSLYGRKKPAMIRLLALRDARDTVLGIHKLRALVKEPEVDPRAKESEVEKALLDKFDAFFDYKKAPEAN